MNRLTMKIAAVALAVLMLGGVSSQARDKKPKHKKNQDLSANPLAGVKSKQPDKELFDKAMMALKKNRFDVARLDLQTMLNTYPDSEYRMRAKLAVGDTWFKEGGTAALTQAEAEYKDFITFFPNAPEAAEAQMKVGDIYYQQMEKPDRDYTNAQNAEREYRAMINHVPRLDSGAPRQAEAARRAGGSGRARNPDRPLLRKPRQLFRRHRPPADRGRHLSALLQERSGAAGHRRRLCRRGALAIQMSPNLPGAVRSGCTRSIRTKPLRLTPRSSPAIPWLPTSRMPATAWWP